MEKNNKVEDLIKQAKLGKQLAFTNLYNMFEKVIYNTSYNVVKDPDVAEDMVSITFTKAFLNIDKYVNNISFEMWLKTIALHNSIDYIRKMKKEKENYSMDNEDCFIQLSDMENSPEEKFVFEELESAVKERIDNLKPIYRNVMKLKLEGLSYNEISKKLNIKEERVKQLLFNARKKIKEFINQY